MFKKISLLLCLCFMSFAACTNKGSGCDANQTCTEEFRSVGVQFVDKDGNNVIVEDMTATNLRTKAAVVAKNVLDPGFSPEFHFIATDSNKDEFSTGGDDVKITGTSKATGKTVTAKLKLSGGCNCHISKLSGPDKIVFE